MAKFYKLLAISCWLLAVSCQEGREAGDLWGQWRTDGQRYLSFSGSVAWFKANGAEVFGNFQHQDEAKDTTMVEEAFGFKPFANIRLKIEKLNDDDLVLSKEGITWSFYKH